MRGSPGGRGNVAGRKEIKGEEGERVSVNVLDKSVRGESVYYSHVELIANNLCAGDNETICKVCSSSLSFALFYS